MPTMVPTLNAGGEDMAKAARRAMLDVSGIDLTVLDLTEGSVLEQALVRVLRERQEHNDWEYASFLNSTGMDAPTRSAPDDLPPREAE